MASIRADSTQKKRFCDSLGLLNLRTWVHVYSGNTISINVKLLTVDNYQ